MSPNNADKRKAVIVLLNDAEWSGWSDREIAKRCHVSHMMVRITHSSLETVSSEEPQQSTYTTKHGSKSTMDAAGQQRQPNRVPGTRQLIEPPDGPQRHPMQPQRPATGPSAPGSI